MDMSDKLKIFTYPDRVLKTKAKPIEDIDEDLQNLIDAMAETMYGAPGIGLAANQVGELKRILVYDLSPKENGRHLSVLINPEIVQAEGKIVHEEACLSVIDFSSDVTRASPSNLNRGMPVGGGSRRLAESESVIPISRATSFS